MLFLVQEIAEFTIPIFAPEKSNNIPELNLISGTVIVDSYRITPILLSTARK
jgi:hypothetical protein